jgi:thiol:disulfide interchange protein DsbD
VVGHHHRVSKWRGALLSFAYVQGMALTYAVIGIGAAMTGTFLVAALQNPWVLGAFGLFFVAMALSMFGLYTLQLPNALQGRLSVWSNRLPGGHLLPVFAMGALSALIVGPCVAPPLAAALGYIGQTGDVWIGGLALYSMALGIGLPLIFVGVFGGHVLPRAGAWMDAVKEAFGIVMLLVALWITRPILPEWFIMLALAALLIAIAVQLHALEPIPAGASGWRKVGKALGLLLLLIGVAELVGLLAGARDPFQPLKGVWTQTGTSAPAKPAFTKVSSVAELDAALAAARGKPVLLDFSADWCVACIEMEKLTFSDARVAARMQDFVLLKADVTDNTAAHQALLARFKLFGPPGIIFFDRQGRERAERLVGFEAAAPFLARLDRAMGA